MHQTAGTDFDLNRDTLKTGHFSVCGPTKQSKMCQALQVCAMNIRGVQSKNVQWT
jgi:hypothetical protein